MRARALSRRAVFPAIPSGVPAGATALVSAGTLNASFSRASAAGYRGTDGATFLTAAAGVPRFSGAARRFLAELQRDNYVRYSGDFSNTAWGAWDGASKSLTNLATPVGAATGARLALSASPSSRMDIEVFGASGSEWTVSAWVRSDTPQQFRLCYVGDVPVYSPDMVSTPTWTRYTWSYFTYDFAFHFGIANGSAGAAGSLDVGHLQAEHGYLATSEILTGNDLLTRAADVAVYTLAGSAALSGTLFVSTVVTQATSSEPYRNITSLTGDGGNEIYANIGGDGSLNLGRGIDGNYGGFGSLPMPVNALTKVAIGWGGGTTSISVNGSTAYTSDAPVVSTPLVGIGGGGGGNGPLQGEMGLSWVHPTRMTDAQLQALTA